MDVSNTTTTDTQYRPTTSPPKRGPAVDWKNLLKGQRVSLKDPTCPFEIEFRVGKQVISCRCTKPMRLVTLLTVRKKLAIRCYPKSSKADPKATRSAVRTTVPAPATPPAAHAAR